MWAIAPQPDFRLVKYYNSPRMIHGRIWFRCDEGGWVDIDAAIDGRNNDIFPPSTSRAKRYMGIMEVIKWQESGHKKSRFQVLAARFWLNQKSPSPPGCAPLAGLEELLFFPIQTSTISSCGRLLESLHGFG